MSDVFGDDFGFSFISYVVEGTKPLPLEYRNDHLLPLICTFISDRRIATARRR